MKISKEDLIKIQENIKKIKEKQLVEKEALQAKLDNNIIKEED